jgi:hypothetical protein
LDFAPKIELCDRTRSRAAILNEVALVIVRDRPLDHVADTVIKTSSPASSASTASWTMER